jgi:rhodanese-related sulfurtransferase
MKFCYLFFCSLFFFSFLSLSVFASTDLGEEDFYAFITQPNAIILDIRWPAVYREAHLQGAILLDNSRFTSESARNSQALVILNNMNASFDTPIGLLCNCPDGGQARMVESFLIKQEYSNTAHFKYSFDTWSNFIQLVSGDSPDGDPLPSDPFDSDNNFFESLLFLFGIIALPLMAIGTYFYRKTTSMGSDIELESKLTRSDQRRNEELAKMKEILYQEDKKVSKRPKRR